MDNLIQVALENGISVAINVVVVLYIAKKFFKDEPKELQEIIQNNTHAMQKMADIAQNFKDAADTNVTLSHKILTSVKVADGKNDVILKVLLKEKAEDVIEGIKKRVVDDDE